MTVPFVCDVCGRTAFSAADDQADFLSRSVMALICVRCRAAGWLPVPLWAERRTVRIEKAARRLWHETSGARIGREAAARFIERIEATR